MATTVRDFNAGLYHEHLEEASFLYTQRLALRAMDEFSWLDLAPFEDRLEAHLDALVVGGDAALAVCAERCETGDEGELFAAICVFCRHSRADHMTTALRGLTVDASERVRAVTDALNEELPVAWTPFVERALLRRDPLLTQILATVAAHRRLPVAGPLQCFGAVDGPQAEAIATALGRLRCTESRAMLTAWLSDPSERTRAAAVMALLRLGLSADAALPPPADSHTPWQTAAWALVGNHAAASAFARVEAPLRADQLLAIGGLGHPQTLGLLQQHLTLPTVAASAARALHWITGAAVYADNFVEEPSGEDELFDDELQAWKSKGVMARRPDGAPYGHHRRFLSTDPAHWRAWLQENQKGFAADRRCRSGQPVTPAILVDNLAHRDSDRWLRAFAAEELAVRYGCDVPFEVDWPVAQQLASLRRLRQWAEAYAERFEPGRWYVGAALAE